MRICDRIVTVGLFLLLLFTPLAFGAVFSWARITLQVSVGLLVVVWLAKVLLTRRTVAIQPARRRVSPFVLPLLLFFSFLLFQLLPLPPSLLHSLSPATYSLYTNTLPDWPHQAPYAELASLHVKTPQPVALDSAPPVVSSQPGQADILWSDIPWYPLSVAPDLSRTDLLALLAYASLFFVVVCYPFGQPSSSEQAKAEARFLRVMLLAILAIGLLIALVGIVQRATWNGKLLWFFVPDHWEGPRLYLSRASGPFTNSDHFANYLSLIFPLLLASSVFQTFVAPSGWDKAFRVVCGTGVFVVFLALLLSLSRGGWLATLVGTSLVFWSALRVAPDQRTSRRQRPQRSPARLVMVGFSTLLLFSLLVMGPAGRTNLDVRLEQTLTEGRNLWIRVATWQDSLGMIQDFPLLGVGLGGWPTLFPRYQRPPWSSTLWEEAHNDYIECLAETGLIGFGLLGWFFWRIGRRLIRSFPTLPATGLPVYAALCAALMGMAVHEVFDFSLQIPANAVLFSVLLALAVRMAVTDWRQTASAPTSASSSRPALVSGLGALIVVPGLLALAPRSVPLEEPTSFAEARRLLLAYPTSSFAHLSLHDLLEETERRSTRLQELEIALWLDPRDPFVRDLYAQELRQQGNEAASLTEMSRSLFFSPSLSTHLDLTRDNIPLLSEAEQAAVEAGLKQALAAGYPDALKGLGRLYALLGRFTDQAQVYAEAAAMEKDPAKQFQYLLKAGLAYGEAELSNGVGFSIAPIAYSENPENIDASELHWTGYFWADPKALEKAEQLLRQAAEISPRDPRPYEYLVDNVLTLQADLSAAKDTVAMGIERGADPFPLYVALGKAAHILQDEEEAKQAFQKALTLQPNSFAVHARLGRMYMQLRNYNQAALALRKASEADPNKAWVFYTLGVAEERSFRFFEADKAYAKAIDLDPRNTRYQRRYTAFQQRLATNLETEDK